MARREQRLDAFTRSYIETALWSSTDESTDEGGDPLDDNYSASDIAAETMVQMVKDCAEFQERYANLLSASELDDEKAGHYFWLSRNGHGSGFFDEDLEQLQNASELYGEFNLYVGDDGRIHGSPLSTQHGGVNESGLPRRAIIGRSRVMPYDNALKFYTRHGYPPPGWAIGMQGLYKKGSSNTKETAAGHTTRAVRDYVAVNSRGRPVFGPTKDYDKAKQEADRAGGYVKWANEQKAAEARRSPRGGSTRRISSRAPEMTRDSVMKIATQLSARIHGDLPKYIEDGHRWSDRNESAAFMTYSPEHRQPVLVLVSIFQDGTVSLDFFSSENRSELDRYENVVHFLYSTVDLGEMKTDIEWVWQTVDGYAESWGAGGDVDEAPRSASRRSSTPTAVNPEIEQIADLLRRAGFADPAVHAARLFKAGYGPEEIEYRIRTDQIEHQLGVPRMLGKLGKSQNIPASRSAHRPPQRAHSTRRHRRGR